MSPTRNGPSIGTIKTSTTSISRLSILCLAAFARIASAATTTTPLTASAAAASAAAPTVTLPSQILQVVPACAVDCLATFVQDNYQSADKGVTSCAGTTPEFACLCEHTGANGFTIGEAAIACLTLQAGVGACRSTGSLAAAFDAVKRAAYLMCPSAAAAVDAASGTAASATSEFTAAEQTHRTLIATAVVGTEFAVLNNARTTTTTTVTTTSATTHAMTPTTVGFSTITTGTRTSAKASTTSAPSSAGRTLTVSDTSLPSTLITAPAPTSPLAASHTTTPSNAAAASNATAASSSSSSPSPAPPPPTRLSKGQIVGIGVGSAVALLVAVCAYVALRAFRKRRYRESEFFGDLGAPSGGSAKDTSGFTRLPETQSAAAAPRGRAGSGHELQISSPLDLQQPAKFQTQTAMFVPWHETAASQQTVRNPYAQQTPYIMPPTIRPVQYTPATAADAYNRPQPPRTLTAKALPSRPSPTRDGPSPASKPYAPPSQPSQPSQYAYPRARTPLPADWRPRPPPQPPSLKTMAEDDDEDDDSYLPPPPPQARIFGPPAPNRDSIVTEFAEDGEDEYSLRTSGRASGRGSSSRAAAAAGVGRAPAAASNIPYDVEPPFMSPSMVPRPLAAQRRGDDRAAALRVGTSQPRRPTWQRRSSVVL